MFSTCTANSRPTCSPTCRLLARATLLAASVVWSATASAAVSWHPDLAAARRACETSRRPILAIFTASWSSSSTTLDRTTLASDEAVALITACFEPVCVDVDAHADATRRLGISKVPTACIMNAQEQLLAKFELPATPAGFVAAAARAAQEAAVASASRDQRDVAEVAAARRPFADVPDDGTRSSPVFGGEPRHPLRIATTGEIRGTVPAGGQAINTMAAKVRMLSDFASDTAPSGGANNAIAASFRETPPLTSSLAGSGFPPSTTAEAAPTSTPQATIPPVEPAPPAAAVATTGPAAPVDPTPAAAASAPMPTTTAAPPTASAIAAAAAESGATSPLAAAVAHRPLNIEPAPTQPAPNTARAAPWLGMPQREEMAAAPQPQPQPQPQAATATSPAAPQPSLTAPPTGQARSAPPAADNGAATLAESKPTTPTTTPSSSLLSALQKPFTAFAKPSGTKPTAPQLQAAKPTPATTATAAAPRTAAPETAGSMPVGLEGYCPVTLAERGAWVEGRAQWGVRHRGRTYLFASQAQQQAFLADPDRYTPMLSGDDPVLALDSGKSTPGQRRYGVTYQSRTYLFSSPETRDAFAANPQRYVAGALVAENRVPGSGAVIR